MPLHHVQLPNDIEDLGTQLGIDETEHSTVVKKYSTEVIETIYHEQVAMRN